jgi:putative DNA modification/repair radical SAM protein
VDLTINFYRRNYIEGLFLSSGIFKSADYTMERLVAVAKKLRLEENFNGYIHLKSIPGASDELMREAGLYADRLSVNIEIPTKEGLKLLAPEKKREDFIKPMVKVKNEIIQYQSEKKLIKSTPKFAMIIGASGESDQQIMWTSDYFYKKFELKRVYYSGYIPISYDNRLPQLGTAVPMLRENRLYQTDWLMRFYGFEVHEILNSEHPNLDLDVDPKLGWALRNLEHFPVDINKADRSMLARIPGVGMKSVHKIIQARRFRNLNWEHLQRMGVALNRAKYFIVCASNMFERRDLTGPQMKSLILQNSSSKYQNLLSPQMNLFV